MLLFARLKIINTKRGSSEKPIINVSTKIGVSQATFMPEMPTAEQYMQRRVDYFKTIDYFKKNVKTYLALKQDKNRYSNKQKISKCFFDARVRMLLLLLISTIYAQAQ